VDIYHQLLEADLACFSSIKNTCLYKKKMLAAKMVLHPKMPRGPISSLLKKLNFSAAGAD
jgi:hypothetical protein